MPDFRPVRDSLDGLWRGPLSDLPDAPDVIIATFVTSLDRPPSLPAFLPLTVAHDGALTSFAEVADQRPARAGARPGRAGRLRLWWAGREHRLTLDGLTALSLADLWDAPVLNLHTPTTRAAAVAASTGGKKKQKKTTPAGDGGGEGDGAADGDAELTEVGRARLPFRKDLGDALGDVEAGVRALEHRTRLGSILAQMLRGSGGSGGQGSGKGRRTGEGGEGAEREPGVLENLAGWVRWHTPLGDGLRGKLADRMKLVEKLIGSGDLDSALKLALSLGGGASGERKRLRYANGLPGQRASLDLSYRTSAYSTPMHGGDFYTLQTRYNELARQMVQKGDYRRAAYIYAQLLNNPRQAVLTLEDGKLYAEAARLAIDGKVEPSLAIRMLYLAGERDAALALARRTACFDELAEESRRKDKVFHAYVIAAWTGLLIDTGQPLRALQVSDHLAMDRRADAGLRDQRALWLAMALEHEVLSGGFDNELAARGLLCGPWAEVPATALAGFPEEPPPDLPGAWADLIAWLRSACRGEDEHAPQVLMGLLGALARLSRTDALEQTPFWSGPAQPVIEAFARALVAVASSRLGAKELEALRALLDQAGLPVLATDISKLGKLHQAPGEPARLWRVPAATDARPAARQACMTGSGQILVWRESRLLQLLDRHGRVTWQQPVSDVVALVPVGSGTQVIVIQAQSDGARLLTRFSCHHRTFHPIGKVRLSAWHDLTSESQWLVQIGGEIGALDVVKLCAPSPVVEFLWSASLTERLRTVAFGHGPRAAAWLTVDVSPGRRGVIEMWTMHPTGVMENRLCQPAAGAAAGSTARWCWAFESWGTQIWSADDLRSGMQAPFWTIELENQAVAAARVRGEAGIVDAFQACDFGRPCLVTVPGQPREGDPWPHDQTRIIDPDGRKVAFTFEHAPGLALTCLARGVAAPPRQGPGDRSRPRPVLLADAAGRLFLLDLATLNLTVI